MKNKISTTANDIRATITEHRARTKAENQRGRILSAFDGRGRTLDEVATATERAVAARTEHDAAQATLKKIPAPRRTHAANIIAAAERIGIDACLRASQAYSGDTTHSVRWGDIASASTSTTKGDQYSRACTYRKTDAEHEVTLDPAGAPLLVESEPLRNLSARDDLHLIALYPDDSAVWVRAKGKAITSERGWIVGNGQVCYHSTKSREHARKGFERKHAAHLAEIRLRNITAKQERRARLIARLCGNVKATIADARALGYCAPGIQAFQQQHGIGDEVPLPALIRTGNPSATRLALNIARKLATT